MLHDPIIRAYWLFNAAFESVRESSLPDDGDTAGLRALAETCRRVATRIRRGTAGDRHRANLLDDVATDLDALSHGVAA